MLLCIGEFVVLVLLHPLLDLVEVVDRVSLFLLQTFEFALDTLPLFLVIGIQQSNLQFLQALVQVGLTAGKFLEAVERLQLLGTFALLLCLLLLTLGFALQLIVVFRVLC